MTQPATVAALQAEAAARLASAGVPQARAEARMLASFVFGLSREALLAHSEAPVARDDAVRYRALVARRADGEPAARLLGRKEFWSLDFALSPETLVPRPDSETLVEAVLARVADRAAPLSLLDFGTGTGCLLLALLSELPHARGLGIDRAPGAVATAARNAAALGLADRARFRLGDWGEGVTGAFDIVVANPPYIADDDIAGLAPEVARHDPLLALAGGRDGLACYRALAPHAARLSAPNGLAVFEIGQGQAAAVSAIMSAAGLREIGRRADLAGIVRCLEFIAPPGGSAG